MSTFNESRVNRQSAGKSTGGQFAAKYHPADDSVGLGGLAEPELAARSALDELYRAEPKFQGRGAEDLAEWTTQNSHRIYDAMEELGIIEDSWTRESLFGLAAAVNGDDYERYYSAWMNQTPLMPSKAQTLDELKNTAEAKDYEHARDSLRWDALLRGPAQTFDVVFPGKRRTKANREKYDEYLDGFVDSRKLEERAKQNAAANAYGRAYERGIPIDPEMEAEFEAMWTDEDYGYGEARMRKVVEDNKTMIEGVESGEIRPIAIGKRMTKVDARKYLQDEMAGAERALRTRGRSHWVNVDNALSRAKKRAQDAERGF